MLFMWFVLWALSLSRTFAEPNAFEDLLRTYDEVYNPELPVVGIPFAVVSENLVELPMDGLLPVEEGKINTMPIVLPVQEIIYQNIDEHTNPDLIPQVKQSISAMNEKHERLIKHVKCVIHNPPLNCSSILNHASELEWKFLTQRGFDSNSFFQSEPSTSHDYLNIVSVMLEEVVAQIGKQHGLMYEFISCACKHTSNCTLSTDGERGRAEHNDQYKFGLPIQKPNNVSAMLEATVAEIDRQHNLMHEFISCACKNQSNCTFSNNVTGSKDSEINDQYKISLPFQKPNWFPSFQVLKPETNTSSNATKQPWNIFSILSKPNKPSLGDFLGIFKKPFLGIFGQHSGNANASGEPQKGSGFIFAITTGQVPLYPLGIYGLAAGSGSSQLQQEQQLSGNVHINKPHFNVSGNKTASFHGQGSVSLSGNVNRVSENQTASSEFPIIDSSNNGSLIPDVGSNLTFSIDKTQGGINVTTSFNKPAARFWHMNKESGTSEPDSDITKAKPVMTYLTN